MSQQNKNDRDEGGSLQTSIKGAAPSAHVFTAAGRLRNAVAMAAGVRESAEAAYGQVGQIAMQAGWEIVSHFEGDAAGLKLFALDYLTDASGHALQVDGYTLEPTMLQKLAAGWEILQRNPSIRRMNNHHPHQLVLLGGEILQRSGEDLDGTLERIGEQIVELATLPRKKRVARIDELLAVEKAAKKGRNPDDVARIAELERKLDAAEARAAEVEAEPLRPVSKLVGALETIKTDLNVLEGEIREHWKRGTAVEPRVRFRLTKLSDDITVCMQVVADFASDHEERNQ